MNKFIILIVLLIKFIFLNNFSIADYDEALRFYNSMDWKQSKEKCEEVNNSMCLNLLGLIYLQGLGVDIDYEKSFKLFSKSEKMGNKKAMLNLGLIYMKGLGKEVNMEMAAKYFNKAFEDISIYKKSFENDKKILLTKFY